MNHKLHTVLCAASIVASGAASADILNFRDWLDANPSTPNSSSNEWYGTTGVGGTMMVSDGVSWTSPGFSFSTPLIGPRVDVGTNGGAAGPATFAASWVHPGAGVPAVLVFAPRITTWVGSVDVKSELILNGLSGNGVTISVSSLIGGTPTNHGTITLTGVDSREDSFSLGGLVQMSPGDTISIVFGDNGSYLYDHVNFNVSMAVPAPASVGVLGLTTVLAVRRRR